MTSRLSWPRSTTVSRIWAAVIPAVGSAAAIRRGRPSGTRAIAESCGTDTYSLYVPAPTGVPVTRPKTASPTRKRLSPVPIMSTRPA